MKTQIIVLIGLITVIGQNSFSQKNPIFYDSVNENKLISFYFPDTLDNLYLRQLRNNYSLLGLFDNRKNDLEKVLSILNWTHKQWEHNGSNEPSKSDALTILNEAKGGKKFRCVEYGIVSTSALLALNYKARVVGLKTRNVETKKFSAGHVLAEVWMPKFDKWVLIDGQFNIMPMLNNIPLSAVEFQSAIAQKKDFKLVDVNGEVSTKRKKIYLSFVYDYLYYLDIKFDQRIVSKEERTTVVGKSHLLLVPIDAKNPVVFQRKYPIDYALYTNSVKDFYRKP
jgi:hypothetical protein